MTLEAARIPQDHARSDTADVHSFTPVRYGVSISGDNTLAEHDTLFAPDDRPRLRSWLLSDVTSVTSAAWSPEHLITVSPLERSIIVILLLCLININPFVS